MSKKILYIYSASGDGGIITSLSKLIDGLNQEKVTPLVAAIESPASTIHLKSSASFQQIYLNCDKAISLKLIKNIIDTTREKNIDIISAHGYKANFYVVLASLFLKNIKKFTLLHGWVGKTLKLRLYQLIDKLLIRFFDKIIVLTEFQKTKLIKLWVKQEKISIIPNGINADMFFLKVAKYKLSSDKNFTIGTCLRLSPEKNCELLLRAFAMLKNQDIKLIIVGSGSEEKKLKSLSKILGISEKTEFTGYQKDTTPYLAQFDLYISPSNEEGLPNSLIEAMAARIPVIASDILPHTELLDFGKNGLLFSKNNAKELSQAILTMKEQNTEHYVERAFRFIKENYSLTARIDKFEKEYLSA